LSRTLRLTAAALAAACWLAAPAGATGLLHEQSSAIDPAAATAAAVTELGSTVNSAGASASGAVGAVTAARPVRSAVQAVAAARPVSTVVETAAAVPPVRAAAETLAAVGSSARPAVSEAAHRVRDAAGGAADRAGGSGAASGGDGSKPVPALRDTHGNAGGVTGQAARLLTVRAAAAERPGPAPQDIPPAGLPAPLAAADIDLAPSGAAPASAAPDEAAPAPPSSPDPAPVTGGGAAVSAGAASFLMGGLAVLLATLSLAGPALRRRLPRLTVAAWPSAFVPLLERPG
jgi:hypothetical protein